VTEHARTFHVHTFAGTNVARVTSHRGQSMRSEFALATAAQVLGYMAAQAVDAPDFMTKLLGVLAGTCFGALLGAVISGSSSLKSRIRRGLTSLLAGPAISYVALWQWPAHTDADPREWIFVVATASAYCAWWLVSNMERRADAAADRVIDEAANRAGLPKRSPRQQDGRIRLVPLVLLAGLAFLAWLCRDLIWLVWAMFTTTVH